MPRCSGWADSRPDECNGLRFGGPAWLGPGVTLIGEIPFVKHVTQKRQSFGHLTNAISREAWPVKLWLSKHPWPSQSCMYIYIYIVLDWFIVQMVYGFKWDPFVVAGNPDCLYTIISGKKSTTLKQPSLLLRRTGCQSRRRTRTCLQHRHRLLNRKIHAHCKIRAHQNQRCS